jgi:hypothetical protein
LHLPSAQGNRLSENRIAAQERATRLGKSMQTVEGLLPIASTPLVTGSRGGKYPSQVVGSPATCFAAG